MILSLIFMWQETALYGNLAGLMVWVGVQPSFCLEELYCFFATKNQRKSTTRSARLFTTATHEPSAHPPCPMLCSELLLLLLLLLPLQPMSSRDNVWRRMHACSLTALQTQVSISVASHPTYQHTHLSSVNRLCCWFDEELVSRRTKLICYTQAYN